MGCMRTIACVSSLAVIRQVGVGVGVGVGGRAGGRVGGWVGWGGGEVNPLRGCVLGGGSVLVSEARVAATHAQTFTSE